jgi:MFS family permease
MLASLALAQFVSSYASTSMNVAVTNIASDLETTVIGVQTAITIFTLTMAALMIPGSKLSDIWGRKACFRAGIVLYALGALVAALAPGLGVLVLGNSILEGVGSALMIPPIYILVTVHSQDVAQRAKGLGVISAAAGLGAASGPLIGGLVTSAASWRASFLLQVVVLGLIVVLARSIQDTRVTEPKPQFDVEGAVLSAAGLFLIVLGILQSGTHGWLRATQDYAIGSVVLIHRGGISPVWIFVGMGALVLVWFLAHVRTREREGLEPLLSPTLFRNRTSNIGLVTQVIQWLVLQGAFFVISVYLQTVREHSAIETGVIVTPASIGILLSSMVVARLAKRRSQRFLIRSGFVTTVVGMILLLLLAGSTSKAITFVPGLLLMGLGLGVMLTASANVVQSSFPERRQGEISGLSRSASNLGSSLGTAIVGSVLVSSTTPESHAYAGALMTMVVIGLLGLAAAMFLPAGDVAGGGADELPSGAA